MVEAFRFLRVFCELSMIGKGKKEKPSFYIFYSEPVQKEITDYNIYTEDFKPKAFLSSPINWKDLREAEKAVKNLPISEKLKVEMINVIKRGLYTVSAVLKNIPLAIYLLGYDEPERIESVIQNFLEEMKPRMGSSEEPPLFEKNDSEIKYLFAKRVNYRVTINVILLLGLYKGISNVLQEEGIPSGGKESVEISDLERIVKSIYNKLGLQSNDIIFERDIRRMKSLLKDKIPLKGWIDGEKIDKEHGNKYPSSRDFLAHSGLLTNLMQFDVSERRIRYKVSEAERIKELLEKV